MENELPAAEVLNPHVDHLWVACGVAVRYLSSGSAGVQQSQHWVFYQEARTAQEAHAAFAEMVRTHWAQGNWTTDFQIYLIPDRLVRKVATGLMVGQILGLGPSGEVSG